MQVGQESTHDLAMTLTFDGQYAFVMTRRDQFDDADEVLRHILVSHVYQDRASQDTLRLALISKLLRFGSDILEHFHLTTHDSLCALRAKICHRLGAMPKVDVGVSI